MKQHGRDVGRARTPRPDLFRVLGVRTLHLIDLENLLCGYLRSERIRDGLQLYIEQSGYRRGDRVIVAVAARHRGLVGPLLPNGWELVLGDDGPDGADRALVAALPPLPEIALSFGRVNLASADHYFKPLARDLRTHGLPVVTFVGNGRSVSRDLRRVCTRTRCLDGATFRRGPVPA